MSGPRTVVVTDHVFRGLDIERAILEPLGVEVVLAPSKDEAVLVELAGRAAGVIVCYAVITKAVVESAARGSCRIFARYGIGYDNVDVPAATRAGILVTNVPDYCLDEVADHTLALLMAVARSVVIAAAGVRDGGWSVPRSGVRRLQQRTLALVGMGRVGRKVAQRAVAFGLKVVAYDPWVTDWDLNGVERALTLESAIGEADFISLHVPLTAENHHLINDQTIGMMRQAPLLINTARGGLVDLVATTAALDDGRLSGVALDVFELEPLPENHPLRTHPRALVTPHMAFYSAEAQDELQSKAADEVARALSGQPPRCPVNPEVLQIGTPGPSSTRNGPQ